VGTREALPPQPPPSEVGIPRLSAVGRTSRSISIPPAALVKLVRREMESDALADWLDDQRGVTLLSSTLAEVELPRALRRTEPELLSAVPALLHRIARYEIDELVRDTAAGYTDPHKYAVGPEAGRWVPVVSFESDQNGAGSYDPDVCQLPLLFGTSPTGRGRSGRVQIFPRATSFHSPMDRPSPNGRADVGDG